MNRGTLLVVGVLGFGIVLCFSIAAWAGERVGGVEVNVYPLASADTVYGDTYGVTHGYVEYRVRLANAVADTRIVHLSYPDTRDRFPGDGVVVTRTVEVAGGQEAVVSIFQPPGDVFDYRALGVRVEGVRDGCTIPTPGLRTSRYDNVRPAAVLASRGVPQEFRDRVNPTPSAPPGATFSPATPAVVLPRSEMPVSQWSTNWLGYSCYDAVLLTAKEADEMPPGVQLALRRYVECGGSVLVHGRRVPEAIAQGGVEDDEGNLLIGFGHAAASGAEGRRGWDVIHKRLTDSPPHVYRPEEKPTNLYDLLIAETTVPIRGLFVLVLLFAVGIGPANLWLLSRWKRKIWLWWNVPAISLLTCLLVFAYSLASEGITGRGKTATMTVLDERAHRATTIGYVSYYCPLTPSAGPRFSVDTDVALLETQIEPWRRMMHVRGGGSSGVRLLDWTKDQWLRSGWVTARVPTYFQIRKNEDRRERLAVEKRPDGSIKVVNALGADIKRLYWADKDGRMFEGRDIRAGAERTLTAMEDMRKAPLRCVDSEMSRTFRYQLFRSQWLGDFATTLDERTPPVARMAPGSYFAYLDKSPFVESALESVDAEHTAAIVYGISKEQDDGR